VVLRLDPAWLAGQTGRRPAIGFELYDDDPNRWYGWPVTDATRTPALWVPVW
jgi:hypothetical protein